ncbi:beta-galactosidase [Paenibacillus sp. FSL R5-0345]|uniref:glycoside hydrolase family 35 protein n=1 Tax=Paenibacillus sp. FSL R5-0345 TaxID=1536770 RepID=UPI0004F5B76C|nr:beta-galactosidase family protein [Paenibacillus sp. FSL R5-0345]AIQ36285.1 beta-galactosidase [Paenibacillus sp. FSL R5-0345]
MRKLSISGDHFILDEQPVSLLSGALHYFRIIPEYWQDRLLKLKACGLNTVETYIPWNLHEPEEGCFNFLGFADIEAFVKLAGELGLHVILRPSPYICAEWEFGGLPAWLLADDNIQLRCNDKVYLAKVDAYFDELLPRLRPLLSTNGGPVLALQVENEYGSFGSDKTYLNYLKEGMIARGMDVLLFTSDGAEDHMLQGGMIDGVFATVNFGSRAKEAFAKLREYQPTGPLMCMEFWNGWFDHWMKPHNTRPESEVAEALDEMLSLSASVNFYMFHGGTNFGFMNGANLFEKYEPLVTSYDYDTLLDESGKPTAKFYAARKIIEKYVALPPLELPPVIQSRAYGKVLMTESVPLFTQLDILSHPERRACPEPMEKFGQDYGFILYSTKISGPRSGMELVLQEVRDRALVFANGAFVGTVERWDPRGIPLEVPTEGLQIDILVENMGRVNYGPLLRDPKGITCGVRLGYQFLHDWTIRSLPLNDLKGLSFTPIDCEQRQQPTFYRGNFQVNKPEDTFLRLDGWTKGQAFINGFNLGRYWEKGPTKTMYLPAPLLRQGENELILFELHGVLESVVTFVDTPELT